MKNIETRVKTGTGIGNAGLRLRNGGGLDAELRSRAESGAQNEGARQLGLAFDGGPEWRPRVRRRQVLRARATWYFEQMRRVVDSAVEWKPTPAARPEQRRLELMTNEQ